MTTTTLLCGSAAGSGLRQMAAVLLVLAAILMTQPAVGQQVNTTTHLASSFEGALGDGFGLTNNAGNVSKGVQRATVAYSAAAARTGSLGLIVNISAVENNTWSVKNVLLSVSLAQAQHRHRL